MELLGGAYQRVLWEGGEDLFMDYRASSSCCASVSSTPSNESGSEVSIVSVEPGMRYRSVAQAPRSVN